jgi:ferredoxin
VERSTAFSSGSVRPTRDYSRYRPLATEGTVTLKVAINPDLCEDNGICWRLAPDVFSYNPYGSVIMERVPDEPADRRLKVLLSVRQCPAHAITVVEEKA